MPLESGQRSAGQVVRAVALVVDAARHASALAAGIGARDLGADELPLAPVGGVPIDAPSRCVPQHRASPWPPGVTASCQRMSWSMGRSPRSPPRSARSASELELRPRTPPRWPDAATTAGRRPRCRRAVPPVAVATETMTLLGAPGLGHVPSGGHDSVLQDRVQQRHVQLCGRLRPDHGRGSPAMTGARRGPCPTAPTRRAGAGMGPPRRPGARGRRRATRGRAPPWRSRGPRDWGTRIPARAGR